MLTLFVVPENGTRHTRTRLIQLASLALAATVIVSIATLTPGSTGTAMASEQAVLTVAQPTVDLGSAGAYSALATAAVTAPSSSFAGATGTSNGDPTTQAQVDLALAYNAIVALTPTATISGDLGGHTITPGVYHSGAALAITTAVTFDALGDPNAVFIFQVGAAVNTTAGSQMILVNGARASRIYWQTAAAVTTGASSFFTGTILANAAITAGAGTTIQGRTLTMNGAVTLDGTTLLPLPDISITSSVEPSIDVEAGDHLMFTNVIRNLGNVGLSLSLSTGLPASAVTTLAWPGSSRVLPAGQTITATTIYEPTLADAASRAVTSPATVTGMLADSSTVAASSSVTVVVHPTPVADSIATTSGAPVTINVLANDAGAELGGTFSRANLGTTRRLVGGATGPAPTSALNGSVTCIDHGIDRGLCTYQPAGNFTGTDSFDYALSQDTRSWNVRVTVTVTAASLAPTAADNRVVATAGGPPIIFDPRANTVAPDSGALSIHSSTGLPAGDGILTCSSTSCTYTPPAAGFSGTVTVAFTEVSITATGIQSAPSEPATITVFVDPPALTATGFVASAATKASVAIATWSASTTITTAIPTCVAGRPATALTWHAVAGATSWRLQRRQAGTIPGPWLPIATLPAAATTYFDTQLGEGNSYEWEIRPDNARWAGVFSPPSDTVTEPPAVTAAGC